MTYHKLTNRLSLLLADTYGYVQYGYFSIFTDTWVLSNTRLHIWVFFNIRLHTWVFSNTHWHIWVRFVVRSGSGRLRWALRYSTGGSGPLPPQFSPHKSPDCRICKMATVSYRGKVGNFSLLFFVEETVLRLKLCVNTLKRLTTVFLLHSSLDYHKGKMYRRAEFCMRPL